jgi:RNA polymerase sigma factor (TIGR02999 family)
MGESAQDQITVLLKAWSGGDAAAQGQLIPLVYQELCKIASNNRRRSAAGDTLRTTALVNEAYLRLVKIPEVDWKDRSHFFALSAQLMRRILVDAARGKAAAKRGGTVAILRHPELDAIPAPESDRAGELVALDDALTALAQMDPHRAAVVELRVFAGLTNEEAAEALSLSPDKVKRDWRLAKAWLLRELATPA